jgi:spermidine/putrescine transport system substrate-binding protein
MAVIGGIQMTKYGKGFSRRGFMASASAVGLGAAAGVIAAPRIVRAEGKITVLNWQGYGTDEAWALELFEQTTGIKVENDYFTSEQEMLTKLRTSPGTYDVVLVNSSFTSDAAAEGLIQPIDTAKITNWDKLSPSFRDNPMLVIDGKVMGVAWLWGVTSFAYNTDKIAARPESMNVLWDAAYKGRIGWRDDAVEAVQIAAIALGQDMNNPSDMAAIREKLRALKGQIATYWSSEDEWNKLLVGDTFDVSVYWSGSAARSKKTFGLPVEFVIPQEGAIAWLDGLSIAAGAPNPDGAHAFIDFMDSAEFYVKWDTTVGAPASANAEAMAQLPEDAFNRTAFADPAVVERLQFMAPIPEERRQEYLDLWQETKTYFAE